MLPPPSPPPLLPLSSLSWEGKWRRQKIIYNPGGGSGGGEDDDGAANRPATDRPSTGLFPSHFLHWPRGGAAVVSERLAG